MLKLENISKSYSGKAVLENFELEVQEGEFVAILGPSGCGKTTLLKIIAGIAEPDSGRLFWAGRDITRQKSQDRHFSLVFQNYALLPNLSVLGNVAFPLAARNYAQERSWAAKARYFWGPLEARVSLAQRRDIGEVLGLLHLGGYESRAISTLSGGEAQRVALARGLVTRPTLLLMDEPLANLDRQLKLELRDELRRLHRELGSTFIYVTHDQEEAVVLAGRMAILYQGRVAQAGVPRDILEHPVNPWVGEFFNLRRIVHPDLLRLIKNEK